MLQADKEAMALGGVRVHVGELQAMLANITHELKLVQTKHHSEARVRLNAWFYFDGCLSWYASARKAPQRSKGEVN